MPPFLETVAQALPRDLCHLVWEYAEPVWPCVTCKTRVSWSTIISWGRDLHPEKRKWYIFVMCTDQCCCAFYKRLASSRHTPYTVLYGHCIPCHLNSTHIVDDDFFFALPSTCHTCPDDAYRVTPHASFTRRRDADAAP